MFKFIKNRFFHLSLLPIFSTALVATNCVYDTKVLSIKGSSSMSVFLNDLNKIMPKNLDINLANLGSSAGISQLLAGTSDFASLSKNPSEIKTKNQQWKDMQIKEFIVAQENLVFVINLPKSLFDKYKNKNFAYSKDNFQLILEAFGGQKELKLKDLLVANEKGEIKEEEDNLTIKTFYKAGGFKISGTAESFVKENPYVDLIELSNKVQEFLSSTEGETPFKVGELPDSNNLAWEILSNSELKESQIKMSFFSWSFYKKNEQKFKEKNFLVLKSFQNNKYYLPSEEEYNWKRNFYLCTSLQSNAKRKLQYLQHILDPYFRAKEELKEVYANNYLSFNQNLSNKNIKSVLGTSFTNSHSNWEEIIKKA